mgnify:FL=1
MGKTYERIDESLQAWMARQRMFFVATAPLAQSGRVNVSPKGHDALQILDERTLAYLDYGGRGVETIAHVRENGRIVIMMCAFDGPPKIYRFHGSGEVITPLDKGFDELAGSFDIDGVGIRAIIRIHVSRISDSCGFGVPHYDFVGQRPSSQNWIAKKGTAAIREYQVEKNLRSIDGMSAITEGEARAFVGAEAARKEKR